MMNGDSWSIPVSEMAQKSINVIRNCLDKLTMAPNPDKEMIALSIGDPTVFGNLAPSEKAIEAIVESVVSGKYNGYQPATGRTETKQAVAQYVSTADYSVQSEDVVICSGCSMALDFCISALADRGDNILVPRPGFPLYKTLAIGLGIDTLEYDLLPDRSWEVDLAHLDSLINSKTRAIVVNNPSNPCGSVYSVQHLGDIIRVAESHRVPIIADEIYEHFVFDGESFSYLAPLSKNVPILSCGGLTKRFLVPGWRFGWIVIHDRNRSFTKVRTGLKNLSNRILGSNSIVQGAMKHILTRTPDKFFRDTIVHIQENAILAFDLLSKCPGLHPIKPLGAMYMMVRVDVQHFPSFSSDFEFVDALVSEQSVFPLPGECFSASNYVRIVLTLPRQRMIEACARIFDFCQAHYNGADNTSGATNGL